MAELSPLPLLRLLTACRAKQGGPTGWPRMQITQSSLNMPLLLLALGLARCLLCPYLKWEVPFGLGPKHASNKCSRSQGPCKQGSNFALHPP
jgi:hypothetical protein